MDIIEYQRGDKTALTENLVRSEFDCPCGCADQLVDPELAQKLQLIRDKLGKSIKITSGYRCLKRNLEAGGGTNSRHRYGMAADWRTLNRSVNPVALGIIAQAVGFGGVGIYWHSKGAFCHADTRKSKATWLCTTPEQYPSTTYNAFILPTIRRGSTGAANRSATILLQRLLGVNPDGIFGEKTETALLKAQQKHKLVEDGVCGPASWKAISGADKYL